MTDDIKINKGAISIPITINGVEWRFNFNPDSILIQCDSCKDGYTMQANTIQEAYEQLSQHLNTFHIDMMIIAYYESQRRT